MIEMHKGPKPTAPHKTAPLKKAETYKPKKKDPEAEKLNKAANDSKNDYLDLTYVSEQFADYLTKIAKRTIKPSDMRVTHLASDASAIAFCYNQFLFYKDKKNRPDLTPMYLYSGSDQTVVKMGDTLGDLDEVVAILNKKTGLNFTRVTELLL